MPIYEIWLGTLVLVGILCIEGVVGRIRRGTKAASGSRLFIIVVMVAFPLGSAISIQRSGDVIDESIWIFGILVNIAGVVYARFDPWNLFPSAHDPESRWGQYVAKNPPIWHVRVLVAGVLAAGIVWMSILE